mgnify:CR=1 FL=1
MTRKKVLILTDFALAKTGFARSAKALLSYLYKKDKYDLVHLCVGMNEASADLKRTPWKSLGTMPNSQDKMAEINRDPKLSKIAHYGAYYLDEIIQKEKPDVFIGAQDIWGLDFAVNKHWFDKISSVVWTTLDSLPLLSVAVELAPEIKNYWMWSSFATKEMHRLGHKHVKTVHGIIDTHNFKKLSPEKKQQLRQQNNIPEDCYVIGYVFRNQLRKSVPNLIEGFKKFRDKNPHIKNTKLLLHTSFLEGWDIKALTEEHKVDWNDILTTHICSKCHKYEVKPFIKPNDKCRFCLQPNSVNTTGVGFGVSEPELNEIYNLMDVYCHPFTSGGQEIPIQEAKLAELITLVTDYSCGEEMCSPPANSYNLKWSEYREFGTQFIKASTDSDHIALRLGEIYNMDSKQKEKIGNAARNWTLQNFSVESIGKQIEKFIDSSPIVDKENYPKTEKMDPDAEVPPHKEATEWVKSLYKNILKTKVTSKDEGLLYWLGELSKGAAPAAIENYFRGVAKSDNLKSQNISLEEKLKSFKNNKRILYVMPEGELDIYVSSSLFASVKELYPDHDLYVACKPMEALMLFGNPYVDQVLNYEESFSNPERLKCKNGKDLFEVVYTPHLNKNNFTQIVKTNC